MTEVVATKPERDEAGRFQTGHKSLSDGRPRGSRSKFSEAVCADVAEAWHNAGGAPYIEKCMELDPVGTLRILVGLLPKDVRIDVSLDAVDFADKFRAALAALHDGDMLEPLPRKPMRLLDGR